MHSKYWKVTVRKRFITMILFPTYLTLLRDLLLTGHHLAKLESDLLNSYEKWTPHHVQRNTFSHLLLSYSIPTPTPSAGRVHSSTADGRSHPPICCWVGSSDQKLIQLHIAWPTQRLSVLIKAPSDNIPFGLYPDSSLSIIFLCQSLLLISASVVSHSFITFNHQLSSPPLRCTVSRNHSAPRPISR